MLASLSPVLMMVKFFSMFLFQDDGGAAAAGLFAGVFFLVFLVFGLLMYVYMSYSLMTIANKTGTPNGWLAWIPVANIYLMVTIARKPAWWIVLFFIPFANLIASVLVFMGIAEACGKPGWVGLLMLVPVPWLFSFLQVTKTLFSVLSNSLPS